MRQKQKALAEFVSEAQETIDLLGRELMHLDGGARPASRRPDVLNAVFRAAHTLKGLSSMFGVERMSRLAHALEDLLDDVRMGRRGLERGRDGPPPRDARGLLADHRGGGGRRGAATTDAAARLTERLRAHEPARAAAPRRRPRRGRASARRCAAVLTEYEEHRLRANVQKGVGLFRVRVSYDLASFDQELSGLNGRLEADRRGGLDAAVHRRPRSRGASASSSSSRRAEARERGAARGRPGRGGRGRSARPAAAAPPPAAARRGPRGPARLGRRRRRPRPPPSRARTTPARSARFADGAGRHPQARLAHERRRRARAREVVRSRASPSGCKAQGGDAASPASCTTRTASLERKLDELQEGILEVRMVPLGQVFDKLARMVRQDRARGRQGDRLRGLAAATSSSTSSSSRSSPTR